ncbi:hypothetical protein TNCV_684641 [Trichonephila clavipes]|nr:hypothetical protein TNCV_684641 [Trichonephila clavipes]
MSSFLVLCEGDTRSRWRDGQVCPDVRQGTMAPWARRLVCVLACYAQIGRGRGEKKKGRERTDGRRGERMDGRRRERRRKEKREETAKKNGERKGLCPEIGVKKTMNAGGVENGNMN